MKADALLREFWGQLQDTEHEIYFKEMYNRNCYLLRQVMGLMPSGRVLDVGASPGHLLWLFRHAGYEVAGIDLFPDAPFLPASALPRKDLFREFNLPVVQTDAQVSPLPFGDNTFDVVFFCEMLEHLTGSPALILSEIRRVLRDGGRVYITTPNVVALRNRIRMLLGLNIHTSVEILYNVAPYKRHNREYTLSEVVDVVSRAGLRVVRREHHIFQNPARYSDSAVTNLIRIILKLCYYTATIPMPSLRSSIFVAAEKSVGADPCVCPKTGRTHRFIPA
ncbi:MAG: class I SAM-dependent methyltransferase [bacterium]